MMKHFVVLVGTVALVSSCASPSTPYLSADQFAEIQRECKLQTSTYGLVQDEKKLRAAGFELFRKLTAENPNEPMIVDQDGGAKTACIMQELDRLNAATNIAIPTPQMSSHTDGDN